MATSVETRLATIGDGFTPKSLDYSAGSGALIRHDAFPMASYSGPCLDGNIYSCQSNAMQLYIRHAKLMLDAVRTTVKSINPSFSKMKTGQQGDGEEADHADDQAAADGKDASEHDETFDWKMTSETEYQVILKEKDAAKMYLSVKDNQYEVEFDIGVLTGGTYTGAGRTKVTYTDETHWEVDSIITGQKCDEADPRAPTSIRVYMTRAGTLWKGKAQLYNGIWSYGGHPLAGPENQISCSIEPSDVFAMNFYMEFIGNDVAAKANVYWLLRNKDSLDDIADWGTDKSCEKLLASYYAESGDSCERHYEDPKDVDLREYPNPFCNPDSTDIASFADDCATIAGAEEVTAAAFDSQTGWDPPATFYTTQVAVSTSFK